MLGMVEENIRKLENKERLARQKKLPAVENKALLE